MSHLDGLFGIRGIFRSGVELVTRRALDFVGSGWTITDNPVTGRTEVSFAGGGGGGASDAVDVSFDDTEAELEADNVQEAIDALAAKFPVEADNLAFGCVTTPKIGFEAVTSAAIAADSITSYHIADGTCSLSYVLGQGADAGSTEIENIGAATSATSAARADGRVFADAGVPTAESGVVVQRPRSSDGALITRLSSNGYEARLHAAPVDTSSTSTTDVATLTIANSTTADIAVLVIGVNSTTPGRCSLSGRLLVHADGSGAITVDSSTLAFPDSIPETSPGAWVAYASALTTDVSTANTLKLRVVPGNSNAVRWRAVLSAEVVE